MRDGRRIKGRYTVLQDDLAKGARHDDAVTRVTFGIDVHALSAEHNKNHAIMPKNIKMQPYDIPLRALIAKEVDGLMMAGRCISGDFITLELSRHWQRRDVGENAGVTAALAAKSKRMPHDVSWSEGEAKLKAMGQRV
ncbi:MAG: FAD-dependent oxidoreductase [Prosthecobacter sp.]